MLSLIGVTSIVLASFIYSYQLIFYSSPAINYIRLHLIFEAIARRPDSILKVRIYIPRGVTLIFSGSKVRIIGSSFNLVGRYDPSGIVVSYSKNEIYYKISFNELTLSGENTYYLTIMSKPGVIIIKLSH